jgi:hypothetical protein
LVGAQQVALAAILLLLLTALIVLLLLAGALELYLPPIRLRVLRGVPVAEETTLPKGVLEHLGKAMRVRQGLGALLVIVGEVAEVPVL